MTKVAVLLKTVRQEKGYELQEISRKIKIPVKYLQAFEEGESHLYLNEPYCSLSVKDYAEFLGLNGQEIIRLFRRDYIEKNEDKKTLINTSGITPKTTFSLAVIIMVCLFIAYLINEFLRFSKPPSLAVSWPSIITSDVAEISGKTNPNATVRINQDLVIINNDGYFSKKINIKKTNGFVVIEAKSPGGKTTVEEKTLNPTTD